MENPRVTPGGEETLDPVDRVERALGLSYRYLNRRDRTVSEVRRHLEGRGFDSATLEEALRTLGELGYLDDTRFARLLAQDKRELEQWGSERIRRQLVARGVEPDLIDATLQDANSDTDPDVDGGTELDRALGVLRRRFPSPPRDRRERERALGMLLRKGYDSELALDALATHSRGAEGPAT